MKNRHSNTSKEKGTPTPFLSDPNQSGARLSVWFHDGNIVLQTEQTIFRVYRGVLSSRSPIFKDMLSIPPPEDQEKLAGCPLVRMSDKAIDFYYFLKALFEHEAFITSPAAESFEANAALLRLGKKYEVPSFYHTGLTWFSEEYVTSLDGYDWSPLLPLVDMKKPTQTISLFHEFSLSFLLPVALYHISAFADSQDIFASNLSDDDKFVCLGLREALLRRRGKLSRALSDVRTSCCIHQKRDALPSLLHFRGAVDLLDESPDSLYGSKWPIMKEICDDCFDEVMTTYEETRKELWRDLPELCGLPGWDVLLDEQQKAREFFDPLSS